LSGTKAGGAKAKATNQQRYGKDYYQRIGKIGGKASTTGGFASNPQLASEQGRIVGKLSKRGRTYLYAEDNWNYYLNNKTGEIETYPNDSNSNN
jgi:general stress protein YciG